MLNRRDLVLGLSAFPAVAALPAGSRAAAVIPAPAPTLRQASGRPLWQPVTNRNNTNGTQGTASTSYPATLSRITKTVQADCSELRTVLMGFQMNPYEQPLIGNNAGVTGAYALTGATAAAGGSGYTVGDVLTFSTGTGDLAAAVLIVTRLGTSGAVAEVRIADPGGYAAPLADSTAPATATKRGGGASAGASASFAFTWGEYALAANLGVEPTANQAGANAASIIKAGVGLRYDGLSPQTTLLVPDGGYVATDPIRLPLPKGSPIAERVSTIGAPPGVQRGTMGVDYFASANTARTNPGAYTGTLGRGHRHGDHGHHHAWPPVRPRAVVLHRGRQHRFRHRRRRRNHARCRRQRAEQRLDRARAAVGRRLRPALGHAVRRRARLVVPDAEPAVHAAGHAVQAVGDGQFRRLRVRRRAVRERCDGGDHARPTSRR